MMSLLPPSSPPVNLVDPHALAIHCAPMTTTSTSTLSLAQYIEEGTQPLSYKHAIKDPCFVKAMVIEYSTILANDTWSMVPQSPCIKPSKHDGLIKSNLVSMVNHHIIKPYCGTRLS